jgi:hypothetical protein
MGHHTTMSEHRERMRRLVLYVNIWVLVVHNWVVVVVVVVVVDRTLVVVVVHTWFVHIWVVVVHNWDVVVAHIGVVVHTWVVVHISQCENQLELCSHSQLVEVVIGSDSLNNMVYYDLTATYFDFDVSWEMKRVVGMKLGCVKVEVRENNKHNERWLEEVNETWSATRSETGEENGAETARNYLYIRKVEIHKLVRENNVVLEENMEIRMHIVIKENFRVRFGKGFVKETSYRPPSYKKNQQILNLSLKKVVFMILIFSFSKILFKNIFIFFFYFQNLFFFFMFLEFFDLKEFQNLEFSFAFSLFTFHFEFFYSLKWFY